MTALYQETAAKAVELADALHDDWASTIEPFRV
jgi:type I restriction enzyme S subunit